MRPTCLSCHAERLGDDVSLGGTAWAATALAWAATAWAAMTWAATGEQELWSIAYQSTLAAGQHVPRSAVVLTFGGLLGHPAHMAQAMTLLDNDTYDAEQSV